jgi:hypothetical protein
MEVFFYILLTLLCVLNPFCLYLTIYVLVSCGICVLIYYEYVVLVNVLLVICLVWTVRVNWKYKIRFSLLRYYDICKMPYVSWRMRFKRCLQSDRNNVDLINPADFNEKNKTYVNFI